MTLSCPNCNFPCERSAECCPKCGASFTEGAAWKPVRTRSPVSPIAPIGPGAILKLVVSVPLVLLLGVALFSGQLSLQPERALAAMGFILALLLLLWLPWERLALHTLPLPVQAAVAVLTLAALIWLAVQHWTGDISSPKECMGRRAWYCEFVKFLVTVGGERAAVLPIALLALMALWATVHISIALVHRRLQ